MKKQLSIVMLSCAAFSSLVGGKKDQPSTPNYASAAKQGVLVQKLHKFGVNLSIFNDATTSVSSKRKALDGLPRESKNLTPEQLAELDKKSAPLLKIETVLGVFDDEIRFLSTAEQQDRTQLYELEATLKQATIAHLARRNSLDLHKKKQHELEAALEAQRRLTEQKTAVVEELAQEVASKNDLVTKVQEHQAETQKALSLAREHREKLTPKTWVRTLTFGLYSY